MEKYTVSVFNTITRAYEDVEVTKEVYETYRRAQWTEENDDRRFYCHQIPFTDLSGNEDEIEETFHEFVEVSVARFEESFSADKEIDKTTVIKQVLKNLNEEDSKLIDLLFFQNKTERQVGDMFHITQQAVHKKKEKLLNALKKEIEKNS